MSSTAPVCTTAAGAWFPPADGGAGSLLRVVAGVPAAAVRRVRDLGLPGLLPIGNVVEAQGRVWLRTPQPPGPTLDGLLIRATGLGTDDAVVVLCTIGTVLRRLHARGLTHGQLDGSAVLLDPDGTPIVALVDAVPGDPGPDVEAWAGLAGALADTWCAGDPDGAAWLRRCGHVAHARGLRAALCALPAVLATDCSTRRAIARDRASAGVPAPHSGEADRLRRTARS